MRRMIRTAMVLLALLAGLPAAAQAPFPEPGRPVTVIVPYPPGGGSDVTARPGARAGARPRHFRRRDQPARRGLADRHGGTRPLQAGRLHPGLRPVALHLHALSRPVAARALHRDSFVPLAMHVNDPGTILVPASSPIRSFADLVAAARARPGVVSMAIRAT